MGRRRRQPERRGGVAKEGVAKEGGRARGRSADAAAARVCERRESSVPADARALRETPRIARRHLAGV